MAAQSVPRISCLLCGANGPRDDVPHEPWCASFMRCVDESADAQLDLLEAIREAEAAGASA